MPSRLVTTARCLACDWEPPPGGDAAVDRAAAAHTKKLGHATATVTTLEDR